MIIENDGKKWERNVMDDPIWPRHNVTTFSNDRHWRLLRDSASKKKILNAWMADLSDKEPAGVWTQTPKTKELRLLSNIVYTPQFPCPRDLHIRTLLHTSL
jgi:hypothetical protein